jgi:hypothetical protein
MALLVERQLFSQEQVLRRQLRGRRHCHAGKADDIEQEAADRGWPSASPAQHRVSMPHRWHHHLLCQLEQLPRPHRRSDVVFAEDNTRAALNGENSRAKIRNVREESMAQCENIVI